MPQGSHEWWRRGRADSRRCTASSAAAVADFYRQQHQFSLFSALPHAVVPQVRPRERPGPAYILDDRCCRGVQPGYYGWTERLSDEPDVHICFGLVKGGLISPYEALLSCANQLNPSSRGNFILYGISSCEKDDHAALTHWVDVYEPDLDSMRTSGAKVGCPHRAMRSILISDCAYMTSWIEPRGTKRCMTCLWCNALRRRTRSDGPLVDAWGDMQAGSLARGVPRIRVHFEKMAAKFVDCDINVSATPFPLDEHFFIILRPRLIVDQGHLSPMPLHLTLRVPGGLLGLEIEAVRFHHGPSRASAYAANLAFYLRFAFGIVPKPYFGGAFKSRQ